MEIAADRNLDKYCIEVAVAVAVAVDIEIVVVGHVAVVVQC